MGSLILVLLLLVATPRLVVAYELETHRRISREAAALSVLYEGSGEERRDRDWRKSAARGGGGQGLIGRVTSTLAPNGGYALPVDGPHIVPRDGLRR